MPSESPVSQPNYVELLEPRSNTAAAHAPLRILSLTGGGYRGLFTARTLVSLCKAARRSGSLESSFDVFTGTSIGGLMACAMAVGILPQRVVDAIDAHGPLIFKKQTGGTLRRMFFGALYDSDNLEKAIKECLGKQASTKLSDLSCGLLVPAVDWQHGQVRIFLSGYFGKSRASNTTLLDGLELYALAVDDHFEMDVLVFVLVFIRHGFSSGGSSLRRRLAPPKSNQS